MTRPYGVSQGLERRPRGGLTALWGSLLLHYNYTTITLLGKERPRERERERERKSEREREGERERASGLG